jgi:hypothetical protein
MFAVKKHTCDIGHVVLLLSYFLLIHPAYTIRKLIAMDTFNKFFPLLIHPSVKDFFVRVLSASDTSLNIKTEFKLKLFEYLKIAGFNRFFEEVLIHKKSLDKVSKIDLIKNPELVKEKKKLGNFFCILLT